MPNLKLFVWEGVLTDYTDGIVFALAENEEQAWLEIVKKDGGITPIDEGSMDNAVSRWKGRIGVPKLIEAPEAFITWGGG